MKKKAFTDSIRPRRKKPEVRDCRFVWAAVESPGVLTLGLFDKHGPVEIRICFRMATSDEAANLSELVQEIEESLLQEEEEEERSHANK